MLCGNEVTMLGELKKVLRSMYDKKELLTKDEIAGVCYDLYKKITYYEKGVDEALCAMEKSWKARDEPNTGKYWAQHEELEKELKGRKEK